MLSKQWTLAVLIPVHYNPQNHPKQPKLVQQCLLSVIDSIKEALISSVTWKSTTVYLIDDYSPVQICKVLSKRVQTNVNFLLNKGMPGQAGALNYGLSCISSDIFAFTDSDCVVSLDWIKNIGHHYNKYPNHVGVAGPNWLFLKPTKMWSRFLTAQESALINFIFDSYIDWGLMTTVRIDCRNFSMKASFIKEYTRGGKLFPEGRGPSVSGQLSVKLRKISRKYRISIGFNPDLITYHQPIQSLLAKITSYYRWGRLGNYFEIYSKQSNGLLKSFINHYLYRHFLTPSIQKNVFWPYLILVHGAYWIGIFVKGCRNRK